MRKKTAALCYVILIILPVLGQQKQYFQLPPNCSESDYLPFNINIKLKPKHSTIFLPNGKRSSQTSQLFKKLNIEAEPLFQTQYIEKRKRRSNRSQVDPILYHSISFDPNQNIEEVINAIYDLGIAEIVEPSYVYSTFSQPSDSLVDEQYYLNNIRAFDGWEVSQGNEQVVIGVVDSGIDLEHPDLKNKLYINEDEIPENGIDDDRDGFVDNLMGWDFAGRDTTRISQDNDPSVIQGGSLSHGTWVSGVAAAETNNEIGIAGVGYNCLVVNTKHSWDRQRTDDSRVVNTSAGIAYMTQIGVDIMNLSFGGPFRSEIVQELVNMAVLDEGILVVAAAGNDGSNAPSYPAALDNVISVAALSEDNTRAGFSNQGRTIDISAPGVDILTTGVDFLYEGQDGTSFSAPIVSGAAGLVKSWYPELNGFQVGEVLRVTSNDEIYEISGNIQGNLGNGIVDLERALTLQTPSIRIQNVNVVNALDSKNLQSGDSVFVTMDFINHLWTSSPDLKAKITLTSSWATGADKELVLGEIPMNGITNNLDNPFNFVLNQNVLNDLILEIRIDFSDGEYQDYEFIRIPVNSSFINIERNKVTTTMANNGRIGYQDSDRFNRSNANSKGLGFVFDEENILFEMGLMMGSSEATLSNSVRGVQLSTGNVTVNNDFVSTTFIQEMIPGERSFSEVYGSFNNIRTNLPSHRLLVDYRSMVFIEEPHDQYVIFEYVIHNEGDSTIQNFFAGLYADWDIGQSDQTVWIDSLQMGYVYNTNEPNAPYAGVQLLTEKPNFFPINNDPTEPGNPFGVYDGFTDAEKFQSLSNGTDRKQAVISGVNSNDVSHTISSGPHEMASGDSIIIAFAIHAADSLTPLINSAKAADFIYNTFFELPKPTAQIAPTCWGESATIQLTGVGSNFKWYKTPTGGEPFFEGNLYRITALLEDTTFYVSQQLDSLESLREQVTVQLRANPVVTVQGNITFCEGDSVILTAKQADRYLWSNGATTQSITVKEAGTFSVSVFDDEIDCFAQSEEIITNTLLPPFAAFQLSLDSVDFQENLPIQFTDNSENVIAWLWDFGNGQTSTEQNPNFRYDEVGNYQITLTVTSESGCTDFASQNFSVTSIEENQILQGLQVYPNPTEDLLSIHLENNDLGEVSITLMNAIGQVLSKEQLFKQSTLLKSDLNLSPFPNGLYLIKLQQGQKLVVRQVVKR